MMSQPNDRKLAEQATQVKGSEKSESSGSNSSIRETYDFRSEEFSDGIDPIPYDPENPDSLSERQMAWFIANEDKIENSVKPILDENADLSSYVHEITSKLGISWQARNDRNDATSLTAAQAVLLFPEISCMTMRYATIGINAHMPFPFRCHAIQSLIPSNFQYLGECARLASFNVIFTVTEEKEKRLAMKKAIKFVWAGMNSDFISDTRRWNFWRKLKAMQTEDNWKVFVQQIEACCKEFATIRESMKMDLIPPVDIYEEFERGFATL